MSALSAADERYLAAQRSVLGEPIPARILSRIDADGDCWLWTGHIDPKGYGSASVLGATTTAHRIVWRYLVGDIPRPMQLDHLCRNHPCVNPDHLEMVTPRENFLRGLACRQGRPVRWWV